MVRQETRSSADPLPETGAMARMLDATLIADLDAFQGLSAAALDDIAHHARARRYEKNTPLFQQGMPADSFFTLLDGRLKVVQTTAEGQQIVVRFVNPGELFGIAAAIGRDTYPGTAIAAAESVALSWEQRYWPTLVAKYPIVATNALRAVGSRLLE